MREREQLSKTAERKSERAEFEKPFWPQAIKVLQTHDTDILREKVLDVAQIAPHVSKDSTEKVVTIIEDAYAGKKRKFTDESEINHSYQVALLLAHTNGVQTLTNSAFATALGHDFEENTNRSAYEIANVSSIEVDEGIRALSHKKDGVPKYPNPKDKQPYFEEILKTNKETPHLQILSIKCVDQIAVSKSPLTAKELASPEYKKSWADLSNRKVTEMELLLSMLWRKPESERLLRESITFTKLRQDPEAIEKLHTLLEKRSSKDV